jgi:acyl-[acyl-carrier-protein]-phospholipid O-acyltransferase/long-chain-fatty-acid--[acyl-carrier-protein] ligase
VSAKEDIQDGSSRSSLAGFWSLIGVQFQGAFSDNFLKWLVTFLVLDIAVNQAERDRLVVLIIPLLFAVPFLLFSMAGGYLADRFSKRSVTIGTKLLEIVVALVAVIGLWSGNWDIDFAAIFLISVQAALFGPTKYGLLPELLPEKKLSWGNGIIELGTFIAIITGTMAAGALSDRFRGSEQIPGLMLVALALAGLAMSVAITRVPAADPGRKLTWNPMADLWNQIERMRRDRLLAMAVAGNTFFWFLGALILINTALYATDVLHATGTETSVLLAAISIGIGIGSFAAGYLSGNKIEYGLAPIGAVGIAVTMILLSRQGLSLTQVAWELGLAGFFGGFFAVPLSAMIQHRPPPREKGGIIAGANLLSFVGIALQPVAQYLLIFLGHPNPSQVFLLTGLLTLGATALAVALQPDTLVRLGLWGATHTAWPLRVEGREYLPNRGPALLLLPRAQTGDMLRLVAATDRTLRFLISPQSTRTFGRWIGAIPLKSDEQGRQQAATVMAEVLGRGQVICLPKEAWWLAQSPGGIQAPLVGVTIDSAGPFSRSVVRFTPVPSPIAVPPQPGSIVVS